LGGAKGMGLFGGGGNNRSNRLYRALVDTQLTVDVSCSYRPSIDPNLFSFYATLAPETTHEQVEAAIWAEIRKIQQEGVTAAEMAKAIKQTKAQFAYSSESVTYQAYWLGFSEIIGDTSWLDNWLEKLSTVTAADVQRVAQTYFTPNKQTVGWYVPDQSLEVLEDE
jgi:zinc protease